MTPEIMTAISTVGFPIVAYFLQVTKSNKIQEQMSNAVQNNTIALHELISLTKKGE